MIQANTVTWYSKLLSIVFFIAVLPALFFYIGREYEKSVAPYQSPDTFETHSPSIKVSNNSNTTPTCDDKISTTEMSECIYSNLQIEEKKS